MPTKRTTTKSTTPPGYIFRPHIRLRSGEVIYAKDYGLKAFKIPISGNNDNFVPPPRKRA